MFLSKYGVARHIYIPIVKAGASDFAISSDWTPATGDVKISKNGGAAANVTNLPVAITMGNGAVWDFSLTATEMQAAQVLVTVVDAATKAVEDQSIVIETYGHGSSQHEFDLDTPTVVAASLSADAITAAATAADFGTEIASAVWAKALSAPSSPPAPTASTAAALAWLLALGRNQREVEKFTSTTATETVYADDGTTPIATADLEDDGTTFTRGEYS